MTTLALLLIPLASILGALFGSCLACIPGVHVYIFTGTAFASLYSCGDQVAILPAGAAASFMGGMVVGYALLNTVPAILLSAPDESMLGTISPGRRRLLLGRGYEAIAITTYGGVTGLLCVMLGLGPLAPRLLPVARRVLGDHMHWMVWCVVCYVLMWDLPRGGTVGQAGWRRFVEGWQSLLIAVTAFLLSGLLGFIQLHRAAVPSIVSFQRLVPAFVGLFTVPSILVNLVNGVSIPRQDCSLRHRPGCRAIARGTLAGALGGGFAALAPVVSAGTAGVLADHATTIGDESALLASQGTAKLVYHAGALLLLFMPGLGLTRADEGALEHGVHLPVTPGNYFTMMAAIAIGGAAALLMVDPLSRAMIRMAQVLGSRRISLLSLAIMIALVAGLNGPGGLCVAAVATGIGLVPVLFGVRRTYCLGVVLLPLACGMSGVGESVAAWLGLLR